jgi:hypothetical protein
LFGENANKQCLSKIEKVTEFKNLINLNKIFKKIKKISLGLDHVILQIGFNFFFFKFFFKFFFFSKLNFF